MGRDDQLQGLCSMTGQMILCPAHPDRNPSLSIRVIGGRVLVHCFAGCRSIDVIRCFESHGVWDSIQDMALRGPSTAFADHPQAEDESQVKRSEWANTIWRRSCPAVGTLVETYLRSRAITAPLSAALRYLPSELHGPSGLRFPVMIAPLISPDGFIKAVHRTFLEHDGSRKAPVDEPRLCLGSCKGGAIRLSQPAMEMAVAEGIETALSFQQATGIPTWASWSAGNLGDELRLPPLPLAADVVIAADGDDPGEQAAIAAASRWTHEGRRVRIARAPAGLDFNDMLVAETSKRSKR